MHLLLRERGPEGFFLLLASHAFITHPAGERFPSGSRVVGAGENGVHARPRQCGLRIDRNDVGMRAVGAQEKSVKLSGKIPVGGVAALSGGEARVFAAYCFFGHGSARQCGRKGAIVSKARPRANLRDALYPLASSRISSFTSAEG